MKTGRLPETRPQKGEITVAEEVNHEVIVAFTRLHVRVRLNVRPHSEYDHISPRDATECALCDSSEHPSTVSDLPPMFRRKFSDTVRVVTERYELETQGTSICTRCQDGTLTFTGALR